VIFKRRGTPILCWRPIICRSENDVLMAEILLEIEIAGKRSRGNRGWTLDRRGVSGFFSGKVWDEGSTAETGTVNKKTGYSYREDGHPITIVSKPIVQNMWHAPYKICSPITYHQSPPKSTT
jgi:hypothetical protein